MKRYIIIDSYGYILSRRFNSYVEASVYRWMYGRPDWRVTREQTFRYLDIGILAVSKYYLLFINSSVRENRGIFLLKIEFESTIIFENIQFF